MISMKMRPSIHHEDRCFFMLADWCKNFLYIIIWSNVVKYNFKVLLDSGQHIINNLEPTLPERGVIKIDPEGP